MATFATLPGDLLTAIASYVDGNGRENGRVILRRALGLIICTPLGALYRCAAYEQLLDVLHIVQATGIKQALFPKSN